MATHVNITSLSLYDGPTPSVQNGSRKTHAPLYGAPLGVVSVSRESFYHLENGAIVYRWKPQETPVTTEECLVKFNDLWFTAHVEFKQQP